MKLKRWWVAVLCGLALALPVAAQEAPPPEEPPPPAEPAAAPLETAPVKKPLEDPPLHRWGGWTLSVAAWNPSLLGADEEVATLYSGGVASPIMQGADSIIEETGRVTYHLPHGYGSIVGQYDGMGQDERAEHVAPGEFKYAETRAYPLYVGAFDDGLADGVVSRVVRTTRDFRLDFQKQAFESKWARANWSIGYRQVNHKRHFEVGYYAVVPNLPPPIPPVVPESFDPQTLAPAPDVVDQTSSFSGNGLGASFDVEFTLHPRFSIISGVSVGLIRGTSRSTFTSTSSYYFLSEAPDVALTKNELFTLLSTTVAYDDPDDQSNRIQDIGQAPVVVGLKSASRSQLAQSYDVYVGVQVLVAKGFRVFGMLRDVSYTNVGEYVVPQPGPGTRTTALNAGYEGAVVGLSWRF